jgi:metal-responsive CopG/Arc/MetJ family transcriptional regulator
MTTKVSSFTIQMDSEVKNELKEVCEKEGFKLNKFIEKAVINEITRRQQQADLLSYANYITNEKKSAVDLDDFARSIGVKTKKHGRASA